MRSKLEVETRRARVRCILFRCGSLPDAPEMLVEYLGCENWSHSYAIKLGKIIELKRWPFQPVHHAPKGPILEKDYSMQAKNPTRHHTPDDDPEPGTPGTGEDICPNAMGRANRWTRKLASRRRAVRALRRNRDHYRRGRLVVGWFEARTRSVKTWAASPMRFRMLSSSLG